MDWGNGSDVTNAICNVVMASAAVFAAYNAKSWFSQRSHGRGLDLAEEIISEIDDYYRIAKDLQAKLTSDYAYMFELVHYPGICEFKDDTYLKELSLKYEACLEATIKTLGKNETIERWSIKAKQKDELYYAITILRSIFYSANIFYITAAKQEELMRYNSYGSVNLGILESKKSEVEQGFNLIENFYITFSVKKFSYFFNIK
ncbi:MAG: hypothetical protein K0S95_736 [Pantoea eucrina]|jgi:hypothetical protein|nr:hypothetical protein [Pantoea eucrina]